jgi:hypothetical protein
VDDAAALEIPQGEEQLHDEADYDDLVVDWEVEGAQRMAVDILHRNVKVVSPSVGTVVSHNIGMVQAFSQDLSLLFDGLHLPTIILAIKLKANLHIRVFTFLTA